MIYIFFLATPWGILLPWPGIEPAPPSVEAWSLDHWSTRGSPLCDLFLNSSAQLRVWHTEETWWVRWKTRFLDDWNSGLNFNKAATVYLQSGNLKDFIIGNLKTCSGFLNWQKGSRLGRGEVSPDLKVKVLVAKSCCVWLSETPWTVAHQATLSMGFSRQEYWSELPFPSPEDLPDPGSPALQADSLPSELPNSNLAGNHAGGLLDEGILQFVIRVELWH